MSRPRLNLLIDVAAFISAVVMAATGFLLRYVLPPGSGRLESTGLGWGAARRPITLLWGLTREEWGGIHFWSAVILMTILSLHLVLHWGWIVCMIKGQPREPAAMRIALGILGLISLLALVLAPFLSPTVRLPRGQVLEQRQSKPTR
jgi:hypothetical protein